MVTKGSLAFIGALVGLAALFTVSPRNGEAKRGSVVRSKPTLPTQLPQIEKRERSIEGIVQGESTAGERYDATYLFSVRGPDVYGGKGETTYIFQVFEDALRMDALISPGMKVKVTYEELQTPNRTDIIYTVNRDNIQIQY